MGADLISRSSGFLSCAQRAVAANSRVQSAPQAVYVAHFVSDHRARAAMAGGFRLPVLLTVFFQLMPCMIVCQHKVRRLLISQAKVGLITLQVLLTAESLDRHASGTSAGRQDQRSQNKNKQNHKNKHTHTHAHQHRSVAEQGAAVLAKPTTCLVWALGDFASSFRSMNVEDDLKTERRRLWHARALACEQASRLAPSIRKLFLHVDVMRGARLVRCTSMLAALWR